MAQDGRYNSQGDYRNAIYREGDDRTKINAIKKHSYIEVKERDQSKDSRLRSESTRENVVVFEG